MSRTITDMLQIFPSMFKMFRWLEAKNACYFVPTAKVFAGETIPTKVCCFILKTGKYCNAALKGCRIKTLHF